jgi:hypothetical protein
MTMQRNTVYAVTVFAALAQHLGVDEDLLHDHSIGLEPEDGGIRLYGLGEDCILAFTDEGVDELNNLLEMHREKPRPLQVNRPCLPPTPDGYINSGLSTWFLPTSGRTAIPALSELRPRPSAVAINAGRSDEGLHPPAPASPRGYVKPNK